MNNPEATIRDIETSVYQALVRTSAALYRGYVLCPPTDTATRYAIEGIWAALTIPKVTQDEIGHLIMETPVATVYGRFIRRVSGYDVHEGTNLLKIDAEYERQFGIAAMALAEADAQLAVVIQSMLKVMAFHHDPASGNRANLELLADLWRRATNAAALLRTLRSTGKES